MFKSPAAFLLISLTFLITIGLAVSLQGVLGINIGGVLNLGGDSITGIGGNKIIGVGTPTNQGDVATVGFVDSAVSASSTSGLYGTCTDIREGGGHIGTHCDNAVSPGSCLTISCSPCTGCHCPSQICTCPAGYSFMQTGYFESGTSPTIYRTYGACYKN